MKKIFLLFFFLFGFFSTVTYSNENVTGKFEVGDKTFLLNEKPFVVKAAELHYTRIPYHYWEHRIQMCKALGMNTICLYVFWNIHEQEEGKYNFTGQNDVAAFCRLAQKHGMYVIVRPGPYVCAEWEMGGLPWWLLKKEDIGLRVKDPYFIERTALFIKEVGKQLADLQITKGGNIIMVQVENEYGSYGKDKPYVSAIRDIVRDAGFTEVPLFQCDWSSNFQNNALDDLLWTINFGTGANIDKQFEKLKELRPNTPLMCSEFWSGWFDHWGAKHETRSATNLVNGMKEMLDRNISFSLYMTHGGTSFGHWAGANSPGYAPTSTSYDYDAPINEAGKVTPKYFKVRDLLKNYLPEGETLSEVPDSIPTISIPTFTLTEVALLFDNLPQAKFSKDIKSMEFFDQGWGTILYRTTLNKSDEPQSLKITNVCDWAQIFVDGEKVGTLNRIKGENTVLLPPVKEGAVLDILVEAMGRINFGKAILDRKGITEKVELKDKTQTRILSDWQVYNFPVDYTFSVDKNFKSNIEKTFVPAYHKGAFNVQKTGDTFLDMSTWGKGMVWVNGYNVGRFWEIGPQQTLFVPGCWLKEGENEIVVLDLLSPTEAKIEGLTYPILDVLKNNEVKHRKDGETLDLSKEKPIHQARFESGNGWQTILFKKKAKARYFCLESLSSHTDDNFASIAELEIIGTDGKPLSRQNWTIVYSDSEEVDKANNVATNVFDLQESTFWHTEYSSEKPNHPHQIVIDLGETQSIKGFMYLPRAESKAAGMIKDYKIYVKENSFVIK